VTTLPTAVGVAVADDRVCEICDERSARQVLALDRLVATCARCAAELRRDGIDLDDEEATA